MLRFKQTERISARDALKTPYFSDSVDGSETTSDAGVSPLSSSETNCEDKNGFDREEVASPSDV